MELDFDNLVVAAVCVIAVAIVVSALISTSYEDKKKSEFLLACVQKSTPEECSKAWK